MSAPRPTLPVHIGQFGTVLDVRSPAEFALDHIPGALNCPVLDDDERRIVGTLYKQVGAFEARRLGAALVAANIGRILREQFGSQPKEWRPLVYCWRGGMRSGSMVQVMRMVGWDAQQLQGGYKAYRQHVIDRIDTLAPQLQLRVLCGPTGSAKTNLLHALQAAGAQVLDLEGLARHRGSLLGAVPGLAQPSQKAFETGLATELDSLDMTRPVYVEAESRKIGKVALPDALLNALRAGQCLVIEASLPARVEHLLRDYAHFLLDGQALAEQLPLLNASTGLHSRDTIQQWQDWARRGHWPELVTALLKAHYDPLYAKSQRSNYLQWNGAQALVLERLDPAGLHAAAQALLNPA